MFVGFFGEKCLLAIAICIMVIPARLHLCAGEAPDEKLKIKEMEQTLRRCNGTYKLTALQEQLDHGKADVSTSSKHHYHSSSHVA